LSGDLLDEHGEGGGLDALNLNPFPFTLGKEPSKHGTEIGRGSCEDDSVSGYLSTRRQKHNVTQGTLPATRNSCIYLTKKYHTLLVSFQSNSHRYNDLRFEIDESLGENRVLPLKYIYIQIRHLEKLGSFLLFLGRAC
jgi:hypothetical protein